MQVSCSKFGAYCFELEIWVITVDNKDFERYTCTEGICEFTQS